MESKWLSRGGRDYWCCEFSRFGSDRVALRAEIEAAQAVIDQQPPNSLLVAVDLFHAPLTAELIAFFWANRARPDGPIRKMAIIGVSGLRRLRYRLRGVVWPANAAFFTDWERAKDWLVSERA
jgi:hypothetical protein